MGHKLADIAKDAESYQQLNLDANTPAIWEDGMRTQAEPGTFEWWYFDACLEDGTKIVIVFFVKPIVDINRTLTPQVIVDVNYADGRNIHREYHAKACEFSAQKDYCDVKIGDNYFKGDLENYEIFFQDEALSIEVKLQRKIPSWRPATGYQYFGETKNNYMAWFVPVPDGIVHAKVNYKGDLIEAQGSGYHDHNWGNCLMPKLIHHWYWGRIKIGDYVLVCALVTSEKNYNYDTIPLVMIAKNGEIIADQSDKLRLFQSDNRVHQVTGKPVSNLLKFVYNDAGEKYEITLHRQQDIFADYLADKAMKGIKKFLAKLIGYDGAYFRFKGTAKLEHYVDGERTELLETSDAIWELMYFGKGNMPA